MPDKQAETTGNKSEPNHNPEVQSLYYDFQLSLCKTPGPRLTNPQRACFSP
jgi:hypothetical protein